MTSILYISYDGILEPIGQSQVLGYLEKLSTTHDISLVTFEKADDWRDLVQRERIAAKVAAAGIHWTPLRYHKRPAALATAFDVLVASLVSARLVVKRDVKVVHSRSYVAAIPALFIKRLLGRKFIFDMRGFWADERVERAGCPKGSPLYRTAKWFERRFFENADVVVSLTAAGVETIRRLPYLEQKAPSFEVIPTCTDLDRFRVLPKVDKSSFVLGYVGTADTAYMFEPVLRCFRTLLKVKGDARLRVITRSPHDYVRKLVREHEIPEGRVQIASVSHEQVPAEMARMDAAVFFVKPGFSTCASVPTKLGEFLGCGVPCLGNAGIGDLEGILEGEGVGVILREFTPEAEERATLELLELAGREGIRKRCADVARRFFSLREGVNSYDRIYRRLAGHP